MCDKENFKPICSANKSLGSSDIAKTNILSRQHITKELMRLGADLHFFVHTWQKHILL